MAQPVTLLREPLGYFFAQSSLYARKVIRQITADNLFM